MRSLTQHTTLTMHCRCKGETARKRTDHPNSYTEVKKTRSLTQHTHGCVKASLKDRSSSTIYIYIYIYIWFLDDYTRTMIPPNNHLPPIQIYYSLYIIIRDLYFGTTQPNCMKIRKCCSMFIS